ncbi:S8 family serine peptidase [Elusimicrobiota bacterium]
MPILYADSPSHDVIIHWKKAPIQDSLQINVKQSIKTKKGSVAQQVPVEISRKQVSRSMGWEVWNAQNATSEQLTASLKTDPAVLRVEPDYKRFLHGIVPNDPGVNNQQYFDLISAYGGWEFEVGMSSTVTIVIIDSGIDTDHPDLSGQLWVNVEESTGSNSTNNVDDDGNGYIDDVNGWNFEYNSNNVNDVLGHGTSVAGVAAAKTDNSIGVAGISWGAKVMPLQVFSDRFAGTCGSSGETQDSCVSQAINYAVWHAVNHPEYVGRMIINLSLGGTDVPANPGALRTAIANALNNNVVVVASKGNFGNSVPIYPSDLDGVLGVGSTNNTDYLSSFSSFGEGTDIVAPGEGIYSTNDGGNYGHHDGTSFSSPQVAGVAALVASYLPLATTAQIHTILFDGADDLGSSGRDDHYGEGRLNVFRTMYRARFGTIADFAGSKQAIAIPNPFPLKKNRVVTFSIPDNIVHYSPRIQIYDLSGTLVRELSAFSWDGKNDYGNSVASGVYIFEIKTDRGRSKGRVIVDAR